jgi:hypothetical protein
MGPAPETEEAVSEVAGVTPLGSGFVLPKKYSPNKRIMLPIATSHGCFIEMI